MIEVESQFPSIEAYYDACPEARDSPESDYGVWWKDDDGGNWRVSFVHHTGHFYAICMGGTVSRSMDLGGERIVQISVGRHRESPVVIIGQGEPFFYEHETFGPPDSAEEMLTGWAEVCGQQGSLAWIITAIARGT